MMATVRAERFSAHSLPLEGVDERVRAWQAHEQEG
jgi:hypothetical protein